MENKCTISRALRLVELGYEGLGPEQCAIRSSRLSSRTVIYIISPFIRFPISWSFILFLLTGKQWVCLGVGG